MKIDVNIPIYSSSVCFFVDEKLEDCIGKLKPQNQTKDIIEHFKNQSPENGMVCWEGDDMRLQICYIGECLNRPLFYNRVSHEIYHIANNISKMVGLKDDGGGNEHIAYLIGYITEEFFSKLLGYEERVFEI